MQQWKVPVLFGGLQLGILHTSGSPHMALLGLSKVGTWVTLPPRGIGIILLSIIAGFSVASLIIKPWSKMTNWSEINQSSYRVAMEDGKMGSTGSIGSGFKKNQDIPLHPYFCCWFYYATFIISIGKRHTNKILRMCIAHRSQLSGAPIGDLSNGSASLGSDEPTAPAPTLPIPAVKVVKLLPVPWD